MKQLRSYLVVAMLVAAGCTSAPPPTEDSASTAGGDSLTEVVLVLKGMNQELQIL